GVARDRCNPGPPATGGAAGPAAAAHRGTLCLAAGGRPASRLAAGGAGHPSPGQRAVLATEIAPMTELWPTLLRPAWLLLLVPSVWLLWRLWRRQRRSGRWQLLLPRPFHALLLSGGDARGARLPWVALGLAWLLAVLALAGPSWQRLEQASAARGDALVVILDLTPRMLAADLPPSR